MSRTRIWGFSDLRRDHLGYLGKTYFVDQDGVEPSPVLYKSTVLTVELQIHFIQNYIKFLPYLDGLVDLPRIELGSWQCECHILPLNHRPFNIFWECLRGELNSHQRLRKPLFYPLKYRDFLTIL